MTRAAWLRFYRANRAFLAPWEPFRDEEFFSDQFQHDLLTRALSQHPAGHSMPFMIVYEGTLAGRISLTDIVRGAFQSAHLGYWVARDHNGHGVASAAVAKMVEIAFDDLGLHQLEAGTLTQNAASQRVLTKNGFERIGLASEYLHMRGDGRITFSSSGSTGRQLRSSRFRSTELPGRGDSTRQPRHGA